MMTADIHWEFKELKVEYLSASSQVKSVAVTECDLDCVAWV